jgi:hypothetical protein
MSALCHQSSRGEVPRADVHHQIVAEDILRRRDAADGCGSARPSSAQTERRKPKSLIDFGLVLAAGILFVLIPCTVGIISQDVSSHPCRDISLTESHDLKVSVSIKMRSCLSSEALGNAE